MDVPLYSDPSSDLPSLSDSDSGSPEQISAQPTRKRARRYCWPASLVQVLRSLLPTHQGVSAFAPGSDRLQVFEDAVKEHNQQADSAQQVDLRLLEPLTLGALNRKYATLVRAQEHSASGGEGSAAAANPHAPALGSSPLVLDPFPSSSISARPVVRPAEGSRARRPVVPSRLGRGAAAASRPTGGGAGGIFSLAVDHMLRAGLSAGSGAHVAGHAASSAAGPAAVGDGAADATPGVSRAAVPEQLASAEPRFLVAADFEAMIAGAVERRLAQQATEQPAQPATRRRTFRVRTTRQRSARASPKESDEEDPEAIEAEAIAMDAAATRGSGSVAGAGSMAVAADSGAEAGASDSTQARAQSKSEVQKGHRDRSAASKKLMDQVRTFKKKPGCELMNIAVICMMPKGSISMETSGPLFGAIETYADFETAVTDIALTAAERQGRGLLTYPTEEAASAAPPVKKRSSVYFYYLGNAAVRQLAQQRLAERGVTNPNANAITKEAGILYNGLSTDEKKEWKQRWAAHNARESEAQPVSGDPAEGPSAATHVQPEAEWVGDAAPREGGSGVQPSSEAEALEGGTLPAAEQVQQQQQQEAEYVQQVLEQPGPSMPFLPQQYGVQHAGLLGHNWLGGSASLSAAPRPLELPGAPAGVLSSAVQVLPPRAAAASGSSAPTPPAAVTPLTLPTSAHEAALSSALEAGRPTGPPSASGRSEPSLPQPPFVATSQQGLTEPAVTWLPAGHALEGELDDLKAATVGLEHTARVRLAASFQSSPGTLLRIAHARLWKRERVVHLGSKTVPPMKLSVAELKDWFDKNALSANLGNSQHKGTILTKLCLYLAKEVEELPVNERRVQRHIASFNRPASAASMQYPADMQVAALPGSVLPSMAGVQQLAAARGGVLPSMAGMQQLAALQGGMLPSLAGMQQLAALQGGVLPSMAGVQQLALPSSSVLPSMAGMQQLAEALGIPFMTLEEAAAAGAHVPPMVLPQSFLAGSQPPP